jgi:hypothetical protein
MGSPVERIERLLRSVPRPWASVYRFVAASSHLNRLSAPVLAKFVTFSPFSS